MQLLPYFRSQFLYNTWANAEIARSVRLFDESDPGILKILAHIAAAEQLWFERMMGENSGLAVWPELDLSAFEDKNAGLSERYLNFIETLTEDRLTRPVAYTNSKGEPWASRIEEILIHVLFHGAYHRGQVSMQIRQGGGQPVLTDFIHAVRSGLVEMDL